MSKTATQRPAEKLASGIRRQLKTHHAINSHGIAAHMVPCKELLAWLKLASSIDGRMRLDGSQLNKQKPSVRKAAKRKRATG